MKYMNRRGRGGLQSPAAHSNKKYITPQPLTFFLAAKCDLHYNVN